MIGSVLLGGKRNGQRGRPRKWDEAEGYFSTMLQIRRLDEDDQVTLQLSGTLDLSTILRLREVAFTAIGERPKRIALDLRGVGQVEIAGINTLVTISRVARMVGSQVYLYPSPRLRQILRETGLERTLPMIEDSSFVSTARDAEASV